ncbi:hypothetical protein AU210_015717 [Fusarium oxysporum f. sp. radicis-cucumerinum]|uniref:Uncharacterized protein n=1 Tax=Fusarium oxysporum f. sp. radicis-cucumerinum TaxID=327505 RepID=A0A2H3G4B8_FUSOX|nr:hypothetical protein AU210_015717 [Fusarium oxysporum f. sp. radicis-cucumerinum]
MTCYGSTKAPPYGIGRRRILSPPMLTALLDRVAVKTKMYRDEMVEFREKEFKTTIPASNIGRSLSWASVTATAFRQTIIGSKHSEATPLANRLLFPFQPTLSLARSFVFHSRLRPSGSSTHTTVDIDRTNDSRPETT